MRLQNTICFLIVSSLLSACSTMPISGPENGDIKRDARFRITPKISQKNVGDDNPINNEYIIVDVNESLIKKFNDSNIALNYNWPELGISEDVKITIGDVLSISVYESSAGGLFIPIEAGIRPGNFVTLPNQIVDPAGYIFVPYAGKIKTNGRSAIEVSKDIENKLKNIAIEPQIVVNIIDRNSEISVLGAVNRANRYDINFGGERILDSISKAGGPTGAGFETRVTLQRNNVKYRINFPDIVDNPQNNIFLHSSDTVFLENDPDIFNIFGAVTLPGRYRFNSKDIFLSEAIAISGGLSDNQADPEEVFIYRHENCPFIDNLQVDSENTIKKNIACSDKKDNFPVIYSINLRDSDGYFLAQNFKMQSEDVIYVGNSRSTELVKLLNIINSNAVTTVNTRNATN
jgi:polysaccharide export outer membrane protein